MMGIVLLPILMILVLISGGLLLSKINIWRPKRTLLFSASYFIVTIISFVGIFVLSDESNKIESSKVLKAQIAQNENIREEIKLRNYDSLDDLPLKFTKTIEVAKKDIEIIRSENFYFTWIVIEWNDSPANEIVASYYEAPTYLNGVNISNKVRPPTIELKDGELHVYDVTSQLKLKSLRMELVMMDNLSSEDIGAEHDRFIANRILHLNVPRHFNIIDNSGWGY